MRQYAFDRVKVTFAFVDLTDGLAVGSSIQEGEPKQVWRMRPNGVGGIVYTYHPDVSGTLTLQLDAASRQHGLMLGLYELDRATKSLVAAMRVQDFNNNEVAIFSKARILGRPAFKKGTSASVMPWVFGFESSKVLVLGLDKNLV